MTSFQSFPNTRSSLPFVYSTRETNGVEHESPVKEPVSCSSVFFNFSSLLFSSTSPPSTHLHSRYVSLFKVSRRVPRNTDIDSRLMVYTNSDSFFGELSLSILLESSSVFRFLSKKRVSVVPVWNIMSWTSGSMSFVYDNDHEKGWEGTFLSNFTTRNI